MAKIYTFLADGFEEIEALTPIDLLRRADNEVVTVSIMGRRLVHASHGVNIEADTLFEEAGDFADGELFILPGGGVGTQNLGSCEPLLALIKEKYAAGVRVAAICAAPSIFGKLGFLKGKKAIVYPGMEDTLEGAEVTHVPVVTDGNVTTGRACGAAYDFALELIRLMNGAEMAEKIKKQTVYPYAADSLC